jgi:ribonuclease P protein component
MREAYRLQKFSLQHELEKTEKYLAVFIIYTPKELPVYDTISGKIATAIQRLEKIMQGISSK